MTTLSSPLAMILMQWLCVTRLVAQRYSPTWQLMLHKQQTGHRGHDPIFTQISSADEIAPITTSNEETKHP